MPLALRQTSCNASSRAPQCQAFLAFPSSQAGPTVFGSVTSPPTVSARSCTSSRCEWGLHSNRRTLSPTVTSRPPTMRSPLPPRDGGGTTRTVNSSSTTTPLKATRLEYDRCSKPWPFFALPFMFIYRLSIFPASDFSSTPRPQHACSVLGKGNSDEQLGHLSKHALYVENPNASHEHNVIYDNVESFGANMFALRGRSIVGRSTMI